MGIFVDIEVQDALKHLTAGKAAGIDDVPPELWKILLLSEEAI